MNRAAITTGVPGVAWVAGGISGNRRGMGNGSSRGGGTTREFTIRVEGVAAIARETRVAMATCVTLASESRMDGLISKGGVSTMVFQTLHNIIDCFSNSNHI